ncbi:MAG TPA: hypothetical protein GX713_02720 [Mollicutes bacterium]|nr:hypothetical protein [Mollicutes bacterium]
MKYLKYLMLIVVITLSFYFTEKIMIHMENKNPIMLEIIKKENSYKTKPVNAVIENNTIIPGINGRVVDKRKSLAKMNEIGSFNETFLVYDEIAPEISLNNNLEKIIVKGNPIKRMVSLVINQNKNAENYLKENNIKYALIADINTKIDKTKKYVLGERSLDNISDLNTLLNKHKVNTKICILNYSNVEYCNKNKYLLVDPLVKTDDNINKVLNKITSGSIILINKGLSNDNLILILNEIKKQDLKIFYINEMLSESTK